MMKELLTPAFSGQGARFLVAGGFAALVNWVARFPLSLVLPFCAAVATATAIGMVVGFATYRAVVFTGSERPLAVQIRDFLLVNLAGALVTIAIAVVMRNFALRPLGFVSLADPLSHAGGIAAGAVVNFLGHRSITFRME